MDDVDSFYQREYGDLVLPTVATASTVAAGWFVLRFVWKMLDALGQVASWHETGTFPEPFLGWAIKYGNAVRFREILDYSVMFTDPKAIQHLFSTNGSNYHRTPLVENFLADFTFGPGLLSTRGAVHDGYRKMLNPLFSAGQIKKFVPIFEAQARHACDTVLAQAAASGDPIDLYTVFSDLTLRVIGLVGFGFNFEEHPEAHQAYEMVHQDEVTPFILVGLNMIPGFFDFPLPGFLRRRKAQVTLRRVVNEVIEQKLAQRNADDKPKDLLDLTLPHSTTREAIIHTMTFLSAGHDTSSGSLSWIFATISNRPDVIQRIRAEYKTVIAKHGALTTWEALSQLTYTLAVVQETMRLNGVLHTLAPRVAIKDDVVPMLDGSSVFIPAGTTVGVVVAALHRHPKYWTNAELFIPERFVEGTTEWNADLQLRDGKSHAFYYMPFSFGVTNCIGQRFALAKIQVILAMTIGEFDFQLSSSADLRHKYNGIMLSPANLTVTIQRAPTTSGPAA
ncbi:unnamed protein product [Aphanomyces euteiches]